eukprot:TRINITY_DN4220_c0_g1_i1.p1 TRINITY_DN4220_c0_g1~~TRINITY_DN4220_c0_g1_i1.p1  ORF type:complete len:799 (+),score=306.23 TRINITY_DN4220_c0_g1_i1:73-2469(+)
MVQFVLQGGAPAQRVVRTAWHAVREVAKRRGDARRCEQLLWRLAETAVVDVPAHTYTTGEAAAVLHAYATGKVFHTEMFNSLLREVSGRGDHAPGDASRLLWVYAQFPQHLTAPTPLAGAALRPSGSVKDVLMAVEAAARLRWDWRPLGDGLFPAAERVVASGSAIDVAALAFQLPRLGAHYVPKGRALLDETLLASLAPRSRRAVLCADKVALLQVWNVLGNLTTKGGAVAPHGPLIDTAVKTFLAEAAAAPPDAPRRPPVWMNKDEEAGQHAARGWRTRRPPVYLDVDVDGEEGPAASPPRPIPIHGYEYRPQERLNIMWAAGRLAVAGALPLEAAAALAGAHVPAAEAARKWTAREAAGAAEAAVHLLNFSVDPALPAALGNAASLDSFDISPYVFNVHDPAAVAGLWGRIIACADRAAGELMRAAGRRNAGGPDVATPEFIAVAADALCELWRWGAALRNGVGAGTALPPGVPVLPPSRGAVAQTTEEKVLAALLSNIARAFPRSHNAKHVNAVCRGLLKIRAVGDASATDALAAAANAALARPDAFRSHGHVPTVLLYFAKARAAAVAGGRDVGRGVKEAIVKLLDLAVARRGALHGNGLQQTAAAAALLKCDNVEVLALLAQEVEQRMTCGGASEVPAAFGHAPPLSFKAQVGVLHSFASLGATSTVLAESVAARLLGADAAAAAAFRQLPARGAAKLLSTFARLAAAAPSAAPAAELLAAAYTQHLRRGAPGAARRETLALVFSAFDALRLTDTLPHQRLLRALTNTGDAPALVRSVDELAGGEDGDGEDD